MGVPKIRVTFNIDTNGILTIEALDQKNNLSGQIQIENEKGRLSQREIERMLQEADTYKDQDSMTREEMIARESLKGYIARLRKSMDDFDEAKLTLKERSMLMVKLADVEQWLQATGDKSTKQECEAKQKEVESAWNVIMIRVNQALSDFWDDEVVEGSEKIVYLEDGGFHLRTGFDLRDLMDDPD